MNIGLSTSVIGRGQTGIGQHVFGLLRGMAGHATQHKFFLFVLEEDLPQFSFVKDEMQLVSVPERFRSPVRNIFWHQTGLVRLVRELQIDVLHVPSYRRLLWARPCARVATIHDLAQCVIQKKYSAGRMFYGRTVVRYLARRQDAIVAVSKMTAWDIHSYFRIPVERVDVIYNGLDHARFFPGLTERGKKGQWSRQAFGAPCFLYVARLEHPGKNHLRLIESFNRFKAETSLNWNLVIAGADCRGAEFIHRAAELSPYRQDIHFLGFVSDSDLADLYRLADVFIYPSLYEGFGLPPIEAMACGCPVIASARGGLGEVVERAALIVNPESIESMTRAMKEMAGDADLRAQFRAEGLERASHFDWQHTAAATLAVYARIAGQR